MRAFFDSNVVIYALAAAGDDPRRDTARQILASHAADGSLVLSTQVLMETYHVLTRKQRATAEDALAAVRLLAQHELIAPSVDAVLRSLALAGRHRLSAWDALIVQAALEARCDTLFSEDLQAGRRFGALEVVNPFALQVQEPGPAAAAEDRSAARKTASRPAAARTAATPKTTARKPPARRPRGS